MSKSVTIAPRNPVATFVDNYGEERVIHRHKGRRLSVFNGGDTPIIRMNRAVAIIFGQKVRARREKLGLTLKQVFIKAGMTDANPKARMWAIENAQRLQGVRMGTLYALAHALDCEASDLMPTRQEVADMSGVHPETHGVLMVAA